MTAPDNWGVPFTLSELRKHLGVTQVELAERVGMSQGEISRMERRKNHKVSMLRRYLAGLGCTAHFTAVFPTGSRVELR